MMPLITRRENYNGFVQKTDRLGLSPLVKEAESVCSSFFLEIEEKKHANGTKGIRRSIDEGFLKLGGWQQAVVGDIDWIKTAANGTSVGVEVQVSGRSDLVAVDVLHLKERLSDGTIDLGIIIVPDDDLSRFLTDRTPNLRTAIKHVSKHAADLPIRIIAFTHDGTGTALPKMRTNLGRRG